MKIITNKIITKCKYCDNVIITSLKNQSCCGSELCIKIRNREKIKNWRTKNNYNYEKKYYKKNKDKCLACNKKWIAKNRHAYKIRKQIYDIKMRARKKMFCVHNNYNRMTSQERSIKQRLGISGISNNLVGHIIKSEKERLKNKKSKAITQAPSGA